MGKEHKSQAKAISDCPAINVLDSSQDSCALTEEELNAPVPDLLNKMNIASMDVNRLESEIQGTGMPPKTSRMLEPRK